jgi:spermidine synthase
VSRAPDATGAPPARTFVLPLVTALFFLSGAAGLVYQVLWMRSLGLFFGSDMYGVSIILGAFMAGLALGSFLGGRLAQHTQRPLLWYGVAELGIGAAALPFAAILAALLPLLHSAWAGDPESGRWGYQAVRVVIAGVMLLVPTTLMGATLPLIMRHFVRTRSVLGESGAYFYAINTLGALAGTLLAGFVLLPYLGMAQATACAASLNLAIGAVCVAVGWRSRAPETPSVQAGDLDPLPGLDSEVRRRIAWAALLAFGLSGFGSFALEVAWTRILLISFSATVYSFAATLACFLFGIFLGSRMISRAVDRHANPVALFAALELGVAVSVGILGLLLHVVPGVFGRLLGEVAAALPGLQGHALVLTTLVASFPLLVVPATALGATFPVALRIYTTSVAQVGSRTGNIYASNTIGAVVGSLAGGLLMIPTLGARATIAALSVLFLVIGTVLGRVRVDGKRPSLTTPSIAIAASVTIFCAAGSLLIPYRPTLNFSQATLADAELVYHSEGIQNTIDVVRSPSGATSLIIGGNVEADNGYRQRRHFVLKGHLPLLLMDEPSTVLVVGLGMGITLQATARHPGLKRIDVIELSPEILEAQTELASVNGGVVENPIVHVRIDDGRMFMKMATRHFDMITADPIHPKISRVGYLYTREYYESIRDRLADGGVVCQWMPMYQVAPRRLRSAVKTFLEVFPHATLWYVEGHALLVAKQTPLSIDFAQLKRRLADPQVREDLASIDIDSPEELLSHLMLGPEELRTFIEDEPGVPTNTDDHPYLEYFVPGDLFHTTLDNTQELAPHLTDPARFVHGLPPDAASRLAALADGRREHILSREQRETESDPDPS